MRVIVETVALRLALIAVTPHADPDVKFPQLHRVRCDVGPEHLTVSATNRYTIGHALVPVVDQGDGELGPFDLSPADVREVLTVFPTKAGGDDAPDATLRLDVDGEHATFTDVSGLFPGKSLTLPRYPMEDNFTDVTAVIAAKLLLDTREPAQRLITSGRLHGLFCHAAKAYAEPLVLDPAGEGGAILVTCGQAFIGLLMPQRPDDETTARITDWHRAWLHRIAGRQPELTS